ncbi:MAG: hypothetical protein SFU83_23740 [Meiothermus sp.]|nr:hypothetical protein [Meiothermus sp.]
MRPFQYRKKPVVVEAMQFADLDSGSALERWTDLRFMMDIAHRPLRARVLTPAGAVWAELGDFIIRGSRGEFYPCKPDIFREIYERV